MKRRKKIIDEEIKFIKSHLFKKKSLEYIKYQKRQSTKKKYNCFSMNFIFFIILFILISVTYILYIYFGKPVFMFRKTNGNRLIKGLIIAYIFKSSFMPSKTAYFFNLNTYTLTTLTLIIDFLLLFYLYKKIKI